MKILYFLVVFIILTTAFFIGSIVVGLSFGGGGIVRSILVIMRSFPLETEGSYIAIFINIAFYAAIISILRFKMPIISLIMIFKE